MISKTQKTYLAFFWGNLKSDILSHNFGAFDEWRRWIFERWNVCGFITFLSLKNGLCCNHTKKIFLICNSLTAAKCIIDRTLSDNAACHYWLATPVLTQLLMLHLHSFQKTYYLVLLDKKIYYQFWFFCLPSSPMVLWSSQLSFIRIFFIFL